MRDKKFFRLQNYKPLATGISQFGDCIVVLRVTHFLSCTQSTNSCGHTNPNRNRCAMEIGLIVDVARRDVRKACARKYFRRNAGCEYMRTQSEYG
jgi:hypothetical protein